MDYERILPLIHILHTEMVAWDALRQVLLVRVEIGTPDGKKRTEIPITLDPEAAQDLCILLQQALSDTTPEAPTKQ